MQEVEYNQYLTEALDAISKGAFLTVKAGGELNTMTIGWANVGYIWGKPFFTVLVRHSRHTFELIEKTDEFTVSIPLESDMREELNFCGTKSGRNYDKFIECSLTALSGQVVETPVIGGCDLHYECKIKFTQVMDEDNLDADYQAEWYPEDDYHTLYFGEIVKSYLTE
ncbi:flavin reductase family protein [Acetohalobium arabaticum]|uniref:Flavin reductase domain protein FMN-binding protein n=1 Tax=Acetohalobium arabaticum (strain ATCC 49924 / DSM 5501 / Z-7288) TaxID=574087 RepID=D9QSD5_ACEAZ|nr:flavin reductase family protein [Acetohalobium arabaticum]ADL13398.1 flavin reductase domain protein FMN-binding protein [Acetohalobium arabaticum DSM 5501]